MAEQTDPMNAQMRTKKEGFQKAQKMAHLSAYWRETKVERWLVLPMVYPKGVLRRIPRDWMMGKSWEPKRAHVKEHLAVLGKGSLWEYQRAQRMEIVTVLQKAK